MRIRCEVCNRNMSTRYGYACHLIQHLSKVKKAENIDKWNRINLILADLNNGSSARCSKCQKYFLNERFLRMHNNRNRDCSQDLLLPENRLLARMRQRQNNFGSPSNNSSSRNGSDLTGVIQTMEGMELEGRYRCKNLNCEETFTSESDREIHEFQCPKTEAASDQHSIDGLEFAIVESSPKKLFHPM